MAEWIDIARDHLAAAKLLQERHGRSAISRAYYAVHVTITHALVGAGLVLSGNRQTPPHAAIANLIGVHLSAYGDRWIRELRAVNRRVYAARIDADYNRRATVDRMVVLQAIRDAYAVFRMLEVTP